MILTKSLKILTSTHDISPRGGQSLLDTMRQTMITTDTSPHYATPPNPDKTPTHKRPRSFAIATKHEWLTHTLANGLPQQSFPSIMHPPFSYSGLVTLSHDPYQRAPNTTTLADHIHTGIISTHLHDAITGANRK